MRTGELDLRLFPQITFEVSWIDPTTGEQVGGQTQWQGGAITPVPLPDINNDGIPGNAITVDTDLLLILRRREPSFVPVE